MKRFAISTLCVLALAGCGGMSETACTAANWKAMGFEDGIAGRSPAKFSVHRKACADHGVVADFDSYKAGHDQGITQFCRPQNGYNQGSRGRAYQGVCPSELEAAFVTAHLEGFTLYQKRTELDRISEELEAAQARAKSIEHEIVETTASLAAPGIPPVERANLALEIKHLTEEKINVERSIPELEEAYADAQAEYQAFKSKGSQQYTALR